MHRTANEYRLLRDLQSFTLIPRRSDLGNPRKTKMTATDSYASGNELVVETGGDGILRFSGILIRQMREIYRGRRGLAC